MQDRSRSSPKVTLPRREQCTTIVIAQFKIVGYHRGENSNSPNNVFNKENIHGHVQPMKVRPKLFTMDIETRFSKRTAKLKSPSVATKAATRKHQCTCVVQTWITSCHHAHITSYKAISLSHPYFESSNTGLTIKVVDIPASANTMKIAVSTFPCISNR